MPSCAVHGGMNPAGSLRGSRMLGIRYGRFFAVSWYSGSHAFIGDYELFATPTCRLRPTAKSENIPKGPISPYLCFWYPRWTQSPIIGSTWTLKVYRLSTHFEKGACWFPVLLVLFCRKATLQLSCCTSGAGCYAGLSTGSCTGFMV